MGQFRLDVWAKMSHGDFAVHLQFVANSQQGQAIAGPWLQSVDFYLNALRGLKRQLRRHSLGYFSGLLTISLT